MNALVPLPVLLPLCATGVSLAFGVRLARFQRFISVAVLTAVLALSVTLMIAADRQGPCPSTWGTSPRRSASRWSPTGCPD